MGAQNDELGNRHHQIKSQKKPRLDDSCDLRTRYSGLHNNAEKIDNSDEMSQSDDDHLFNPHGQILSDFISKISGNVFKEFIESNKRELKNQIFEFDEHSNELLAPIW